MRLSPLRCQGILALTGLAVLGSCVAPAPPGPASPVEPVPKIENPAEEIAAAHELIAADSLNTDAWFRLALAWEADGRATSSDSARAAYKNLLRRDPDHTAALVHYGLALEDAKKFDEALQQYERATIVSPDDPLPYINLGSLLYFQFKRTYDAKEALTKAIELDPRNPDARFNLGVLFADASMFAEARREWEKVQELAPDSPAANLARDNLEKIKELGISATPAASSEATSE